MRVFFQRFCVILLLFGVVLVASSQTAKKSGGAKVYTKKELESKKKRLLAEIAAAQRVLEQTTETKEATLQQLEALNKQISARENLIKTISTEMIVLDRQIVDNQHRVGTLAEELIQLKKEYAAMVVFAQRNKSSYNKLMFIFAANDFNQAYKRLKYIQQFNEYRRRQVEYILDTQTDLKNSILDLEEKKRGKAVLLQDEQKEKVKLDENKKQQASMVKQLQVKENQLKKDLAKKQDQIERLNRAIEEAIKREIEAAKKKAEEEARRKALASGKAAPAKSSGSGASSDALTATPESKKLSDDFTGNKGNLPWPVERGEIVEQFGVHPHPVLKGVMIQSNGINIQTEMNAAVRVTFDGEVRSVFSVPGQNKSVLVRHGEYFTVYANLISTSVKVGDKVSSKQVIGTVYTVPGKSVAELHFELWKQVTKQDPADWLANSGN